MRRKKGRRKTRHHMTPKSRKGSSARFNLLILDEDRHRMLHKIFGNRTLTEIIDVLIRIAHAKHYEREEPDVLAFYQKGE